jgi:hypothetical protein
MHATCTHTFTSTSVLQHQREPSPLSSTGAGRTSPTPSSTTCGARGPANTTSTVCVGRWVGGWLGGWVGGCVGGVLLHYLRRQGPLPTRLLRCVWLGVWVDVWVGGWVGVCLCLCQCVCVCTIAPYTASTGLTPACLSPWPHVNHDLPLDRHTHTHTHTHTRTHTGVCEGLKDQLSLRWALWVVRRYALPVRKVGTTPPPRTLIGPMTHLASRLYHGSGGLYAYGLACVWNLCGGRCGRCGATRCLCAR